MIPSAKSKINIFSECSLLSGANLGQIMDLAAKNNDRFIGDQTVVCRFSPLLSGKPLRYRPSDGMLLPLSASSRASWMPRSVKYMAPLSSLRIDSSNWRLGNRDLGFT
jgi:hypothetical protein